MEKFLDSLSASYYVGNPQVTDAEFDALAAQYNYKNVGYTPTNGVRHFYPMYSLQKCFNLEEAPINTTGCTSSHKLDGAAISLLYVDGRLELGLTRGDGITGQDITEKCYKIAPSRISINGIVQITGEVVAPKTIENARNYAAGALNMKDTEAFAFKEVQFIAYGLQGFDVDTYSLSMSALGDAGFRTILSDTSEFPTDGIVYRLSDNKIYEKLGYTSKHPRGAFALKTQKEGVPTILRDVVWALGRSGVISPVAHFDPINIEGALVSKATLHNIDYIKLLNLEIGCKIEVIRSGEIIPRILRRID
jgi:NAD-dependent DNA ligase